MFSMCERLATESQRVRANWIGSARRTRANLRLDFPRRWRKGEEWRSATGEDRKKQESVANYFLRRSLLTIIPLAATE